VISIVGNPEDRERSTWASKMVVAAGIWCLISIISLDVTWSRIADMRAAGKYVSDWRYATVVFWVLILLFWIRNGWLSFRRDRAKKVTEG
jgi:hypothetical protein